MFYIHNVPGRVRIKSDVLKRNPDAADEIRKALSIHGIVTVGINAITGSILIHYRCDITDCETIVCILENGGFFDRTRAIDNDEYFIKIASKVIEALSYLV
ncbi:HMA2 domain-containing protein [Candidatus Magnetominusculus dajiuhuensis]|uniref:HMA2 domain-containing protein n=1 Tax=Candidatus Magnetominusculus dajiuhuensis TaxID=3137712 RepID=UPI003B429747